MGLKFFLLDQELGFKLGGRSHDHRGRPGMNARLVRHSHFPNDHATPALDS